MGLTRVGGDILKDPLNIGVGVTITLDGNVNLSGILTASSLDVSGNVTIGGTVTYEDVTNIDSVGVITARTDVHVGAGLSVVGVSTLGNTVVGGGTTELVVTGDARITGVLTVGQGSVTIDGSSITGVTTVGITSAYITSINDLNYPTAGPLSNRNLIINGAMRVAQRGTSSIVSGFATVDRIEGGFTGGAVTQSQGTLTTGAGDSPVYDLGFRHYFRQTNTTTTSGASDHRNIRYRPEAQDIATSGWNYTSSASYVTLSFWVRSSVSQEFYGYIRTENGTERVYTFSTGTLTADTWTKVTKTIPGDSALEIPNDNTSGLQMFIAPFWGTSFTDSSVTLNTWRNYDTSLRTPDYDSSWITTTNATFDLTGYQLEVGVRATPFEHISYAENLRRCQRYFTQFDFPKSVYVAQGGLQSTSSIRGAIINLPVSMRAVAAQADVTFSGTGTGAGELTFLTPSTANPSTIGSLTGDGNTTSSVHVYGNGFTSLGNPGQTSQLYASNGSWIRVDVEL